MNSSTMLWLGAVLVGLGLVMTVFKQTDAQQQAVLEVTSGAFAHGQSIPDLYSCKSTNISPSLAWRNVPPATKSFAVIVDDPDAPGGTWVHWVVYNLPANLQRLPDNADINNLNGMQGMNSYSRQRYDGPCPPQGTHRYFFKVYALDSRLDLQAGASKQDLEAKMAGHILAQGQIMGTFTR